MVDSDGSFWYSDSHGNVWYKRHGSYDRVTKNPFEKNEYKFLNVAMALASTDTSFQYRMINKWQRVPSGDFKWSLDDDGNLYMRYKGKEKYAERVRDKERIVEERSKRLLDDIAPQPSIQSIYLQHLKNKIGKDQIKEMIGDDRRCNKGE